MSVSYIILSMIAIGFVSCSDRPEYVLDKKEMTALLIDVHKGESVIENQRTRYSTDSMKKVMKQSVYANHGVTAAQVDSSLIWYGNHIEDYIEIYDKVIAGLEEELDARGEVPIFAEGDSVNVWSGSHSYRLDGTIPVRSITFSIDNDVNFIPGDNYQLNFKIVNNRYPVMFKSGIYAEYIDGDMEYRHGSANYNGWQHIRLVTDSAKTVSRIFGSLRFNVGDDEIIYVDSVSLIRTRLREDTYQRGSQRRVKVNRNEK